MKEKNQSPLAERTLKILNENDSDSYSDDEFTNQKSPKESVTKN